MRILVLNGSPKGDLSVTLQYVRYLEKRFPEHQFEIRPIAQRIALLERRESKFAEVIAEVGRADLVLWATPVYFFLVPGQLKRFIELIHERGAPGAFASRDAAAITTSIHFFDHTAHNYLAGISEDLGMRFRGGHSAKMMDLTEPTGRHQLEHFAAGVFAAVTKGGPAPVTSNRVDARPPVYRPGAASSPVDPGRRTVLVVTDRDDRSENLGRMVERVSASFRPPPGVVDLADLDVRGCSPGCRRCGLDNRCGYEGKDGFIECFRDRVMDADILFFAGSIRDRYLSARWKTFFDRSFFRGHAPSLPGKQLAWLISGPLRQLPNLRQILEAYTEMQEANLTGIVTDEAEDPEESDALLDALAARSVEDAAAGFRRPPTFLGVGGHKLFRDAVWGHLRFVFQADHRRYRREGFYDFPQRKVGVRLLNLAAPLLRLSPVRKRFVPRLRDGMVAPLKRVVDRSDRDPGQSRT